MGPLLPHLQMVLLVTYALREHGVTLESLPLHCVISVNITLIKALTLPLYVKSVLLELNALLQELFSLLPLHAQLEMSALEPQ